MPPHPGPPMPHDRHYHEPPPGLEPPPRTWSNQSVAGSTTAMSASGTSGSVRESLMAEQRRAESVLDSTARLVKMHEAVSVAMKLHKQEAKRTRDPSPEEQALINRCDAEQHNDKHHHHHRRWKRPDDRVGFIDEHHTLDEYKATLENSGTPRETKDFIRQCLEFHRLI